MTSTPTWQAATSGQPPLAQHANQILGTHTVQVLYTGVEQASQSTAGAGSASSNGLWIAQQFTSGASQTAVGYVVLTLTAGSSLGANLGPLTVGLYASAGGAPSGAPLVTTTVTAEYAAGAPSPLLIPLPAAVAPSTSYWIVTAPAGGATYSYAWAHSNQTSGASTSATGSAWTAQSYGLLFQVWDQAPVLPQVGTREDGGARWTAQTVNGSGQITMLAEYTAGQTTGGYLQSVRTVTYSGNDMTGVA